MIIYLLAAFYVELFKIMELFISRKYIGFKYHDAVQRGIKVTAY